MPFGWGESHDAYNQVYDSDGQPKNEASGMHELIAGGASFAAFKAFEDHQRKEGEFPSTVHDWRVLININRQDRQPRLR